MFRSRTPPKLQPPHIADEVSPACTTSFPPRPLGAGCCCSYRVITVGSPRGCALKTVCNPYLRGDDVFCMPYDENAKIEKMRGTFFARLHFSVPNGPRIGIGNPDHLDEVFEPSG
jgi:hypothetical protein